MLKKLIVLLSSISSCALYPLGLDTVAHVFASAKKPILGMFSTDTLDKIIAESKAVQAEAQVAAYKKTVEKTVAAIQLLNDRLGRSTGTEREVLLQEIALLQQQLDILSEFEQLYVRLLASYEERITVIKAGLSDPGYKNLLLEPRSSYSFSDLDGLSQRISDLKNRLATLKKTEVKLQSDVDRYTKQIDGIQFELKTKQKEQKGHSQQGLGSVIAGNLIDIQEALLNNRKELVQLKLAETQNSLSLVTLQLSVAKQQLEILGREYTRVKRAMVITKESVNKEKNDLEEKKRQAIAEQNKLRKEQLEHVVQVQRDVKSKIDFLATQYGLSASDLETIRNWTFQPKTQPQWKMLAQFDALIAQDAYADTAQESLNARIDYSKAEVKRESIAFDIIRSWYKFMNRKYRSSNEHDIDDAIKDYEAVKNDLVMQLRTVSDSRDAAITSLQRLNKSIENVRGLMQLLKEQQRPLFKNQDAVFNECQRGFKETEDVIRRIIDHTALLIEKYQAMVSVIDDSIKRVTTILGELTTKGFWKRSEQSIEWSQLKNVLPDLQKLFISIYVTGIEYFSFMHAMQVGSKLLNFFKEPLYVLMLFINALLACIIYLLLRLFLPDLYQFLNAGSAGSGFNAYIRLWASLGVKFLIAHINSFFVWSLLYFLVATHMLEDTYLCLLIELFSIPYLIYLIYRFIQFIIVENRYRNYRLVNQSYERRFFVVVPLVLYSLVILYFLRGAMLLDYPPVSELPTILLALMFIMIQLGVIFLIGKKQVLALIPEHTPFWQFIKQHVEKYYYVLLAFVVAIIVMSNPYVGYGRQVFYILSRVCLTLLMVPFFLWLHSRIKNMSSNFFFYYEEGEVMRERFSSGRLWYGTFIIVSFLLFIFALIVVVGKIWGYGVTLSDVGDFLNRELTAVKDETGRDISVTFFSLTQIVLFVLGGIVLNYIINQFVLKRVFDPFLVGVGVQNTISAFTKYAIILLALFIGLSNAGLEGLTTKFAIIIGGLSFALQEPLRDFFSYFIILVSRPVKIGDLIQINDDVIGIVRHITPRSIVLRKRNSVTIVVPNSHVILNPVINWNYSRSYFAFNDIMLVVTYNKDPQLVKELILQVLHSNYMILKSPAPIVWLSDFAENGYQFLVRGFLTADKVLEQWEISSQVRLEIVKKLRDHGIEIASPVRLVRMTPPDSLLTPAHPE